MQEKTKRWKKRVIDWDSEQSMSTQQLELRNRMAGLKGNLPPNMEE